ncbi:MAG: PP2C family protein-serine/threonine phosphatase [Massilia sp.]
MSDEPQLRWTSAARTDVGLVRSRNEDAFLELPARRMWAVADGMGGHAFGEVASKMVVDALGILDEPASLQQAVADARTGLVAANAALLAEAAARQVPVIGSTVVVLLAYEREAACVWAGDSRIYLCRASKLYQLTRDHNLFEELQIKNNLSPDEALAYPGASMITRALGAADTLEPEEVEVQVEDGDLFLLCSDGLSNEVGPEGMLAALGSGDCARAADALLALALANGGRDNITVVVVRADVGGRNSTLP